jgi:transketolase
MNKKMADAIRALSMDAVQKANSGHPGAPKGSADVVTVLFSKFLKFDPTAPHWPTEPLRDCRRPFYLERRTFI